MHPHAPAIRAKSLPPAWNATSATPLTKLIGALVWLEGSPDATTVLVPWREILEILAVNPPVKGPMGGTTWVHWPFVDRVPPVPPSAT
jgi:hypothetical protein